MMNTPKRKPNRLPETSGRIVFQDKVQSLKVCTGCGTAVLPKSASRSGALSDDTSELFSMYSKSQVKKTRFADAYNDRSTFVCSRCKLLQNPNNKNLSKAVDALRDVDPQVFATQLQRIVSRRDYGLCIHVVDATDFEFSSKNLRKAIGKTPMVLAINKVDLLPRCNQYDVKRIVERIQKRTGKVLATFPVSAVTGAGVVDLARWLLANLGGRDVFCVGSANAGKSTLVQQLAPTLVSAVRLKGRDFKRRRDKIADLQITRSHLPGTTLQAVRIPCFSSGRHALWDTPGIINIHSIGYSIFPAHVMDPLNQPRPIVLPDLQNPQHSLRARKGDSIVIHPLWMTSDDTDDKDLPVLARLDVKSDYVECIAYLPDTVMARVVQDAPDHAVLPESYLNRVLSSEEALNVKPVALESFTELKTGEDLYRAGRFRVDVSFSSIGWLNLTSRDPMKLVPYVAKGSLWSKRPGLYPWNLREFVEYEGHGGPAVEEVSDRILRELRGLSQDGKHFSNRESDDEVFHEDSMLEDYENPWY